MSKQGYNHVYRLKEYHLYQEYS